MWLLTLSLGLFPLVASVLLLGYAIETTVGFLWVLVVFFFPVTKKNVIRIESDQRGEKKRHLKRKEIGRAVQNL